MSRNEEDDDEVASRHNPPNQATPNATTSPESLQSVLTKLENGLSVIKQQSIDLDSGICDLRGSGEKIHTKVVSLESSVRSLEHLADEHDDATLADRMKSLELGKTSSPKPNAKLKMRKSDPSGGIVKRSHTISGGDRQKRVRVTFVDDFDVKQPPTRLRVAARTWWSGRVHPSAPGEHGTCQMIWMLDSVIMAVD